MGRVDVARGTPPPLARRLHRLVRTTGLHRPRVKSASPSTLPMRRPVTRASRVRSRPRRRAGGPAAHRRARLRPRSSRRRGRGHPRRQGTAGSELHRALELMRACEGPHRRHRARQAGLHRPEAVRDARLHRSALALPAPLRGTPRRPRPGQPRRRGARPVQQRVHRGAGAAPPLPPAPRCAGHRHHRRRRLTPRPGLGRGARRRRHPRGLSAGAGSHRQLGGAARGVGCPGDDPREDAPVQQRRSTRRSTRWKAGPERDAGPRGDARGPGQSGGPRRRLRCTRRWW